MVKRKFEGRDGQWYTISKTAIRSMGEKIIHVVIRRGSAVVRKIKIVVGVMASILTFKEFAALAFLEAPKIIAFVGLASL